jgi:hypothetical protein
LSTKRQKEYDELKKLHALIDKEKDNYYQQLIDYSKQQQLIRDIAWMNDIKSMLQKRKEEKERIEKERQERKERILKQKEEQKRQEEERIKREQERREKEAELERQREESLKLNEIEELAAIEQAINDESETSNPLYD